MREVGERKGNGVKDPQKPEGDGKAPAPEEWSQPMNKYILVVMASQEARRRKSRRVMGIW